MPGSGRCKPPVVLTNTAPAQLILPFFSDGVATQKSDILHGPRGPQILWSASLESLESLEHLLSVLSAADFIFLCFCRALP